MNPTTAPATPAPTVDLDTLTACNWLHEEGVMMRFTADPDDATAVMVECNEGIGWYDEGSEDLEDVAAMVTEGTIQPAAPIVRAARAIMAGTASTS